MLYKANICRSPMAAALLAQRLAALGVTMPVRPTRLGGGATEGRGYDRRGAPSITGLCRELGVNRRCSADAARYEAVRNYQLLYISGLLQTEDYTRAIIFGGLPTATRLCRCPLCQAVARKPPLQ